MNNHWLPFVVASTLFASTGWGDSWQELVPDGVVPPARAGHSMTFVNNRIYAFGGYDENRSLMDSLSVFDVRHMQWVEHTPANDPPPPRHGHCAVGYGNSLYIFFGQGENGLHGDIWRYDTTSNIWNQVSASGASQPTARSHASSTVIGNTAWFFGGYEDEDATRGGFAPSGGLWGFNFGTTRWTRYAANAAISRARHSMFHNDSRIYIYGGVDGENNNLSCLMEYNIGTNRWAADPVEVVGDLRDALAHHIGIHFGGLLWLFGGKEGVDGVVEFAIRILLRDDLLWLLMIMPATPMPPMENTAAEVIRMSHDRGNDPKLHFLFYGGEVDGVPTNTTWLYASDEPGPGLPPPLPSQFTLSFAEGWNLISLPIEPVNPAVEAVLAGEAGRGTLHRGDVWQWKPVGATGGGAYRMTDTFRALTGYAAYFPQAGEIVVEGFPTESEPALGIGWNLVGTAAESPSPNDPNHLRLSVWRWDRGEWRYQPVDPAEELQPGKAYWRFRRVSD